MKIELKAIEHLERNSQETHCYAAKLYVDGRHVADVGNEGHGGCDYQHPKKGMETIFAEAAAFVKATFPHLTYNGQDLGPASIETVCCDLVTDWLIQRDVKRIVKGKVAFTLTSKKGIYTVTTRGAPMQNVISELRKRHPNDLGTILNELPIEKAVEIYRANG